MARYPTFDKERFRFDTQLGSARRAVDDNQCDQMRVTSYLAHNLIKVHLFKGQVLTAFSQKQSH
jgi:hypothetical protein